MAIIPLGPGSHRDSSSLPEGPDELGSSPLLFGLAPRGVCRASDVAIGAVSSYPTVSPLPGTIAFCNPLSRIAFRPAEGFPSAGHRGACTGRFIFCGTVRSRKTSPRFRALHDESAPWRYQARRPSVPDVAAENRGVRTFLPASLLPKASPAITRLARLVYYSVRIEFPRGSMGWRARGGSSTLTPLKATGPLSLMWSSRSLLRPPMASLNKQ